jgi:hypothetical protein
MNTVRLHTARTGLSLAAWIMLVAGACVFSWGLRVDVFHEASHAETDHALHSVLAELDSCHRALYHEAQAKSCGHNQHVTSHEACQLCDNASFHLFTISLFDQWPAPIVHGTLIDSFASDLYSLAFQHSSSRAPPAHA